MSRGGLVTVCKLCGLRDLSSSSSSFLFLLDSGVWSGHRQRPVPFLAVISANAEV